MRGQSATNPISLLHAHDVIASVPFVFTTEGSRHCLRMTQGRPSTLAPFVTLEEWEAMRKRWDLLGKETERNEGRSMELLLVMVPSGILFLFLAAWKDMKHKEGWQAVLFSVLTILVVIGICLIVVKFIWDEFYEVYRKSSALSAMQASCQAYSDLLTIRGIYVEFDGLSRDGIYYLSFRKLSDSDLYPQK